MTKTIVHFILPLAFVDVGNYEVSLDNIIVKINILLLENKETNEKITGMTITGSVKMIPDPHGVVNMTGVTMEFPYIIDVSSVKEECIKYLNRLIEVVRYNTRVYWISSISDRDITTFTTITENELGKQRRGTMTDNGQGLFLGVNFIEEADVKPKILEMLKNENRIPVSEFLILDAFNYFTLRKFNEAVIVMNIAFEMFLTEYLTDTLRLKLSEEEEVNKKMNEVLKDFSIIDIMTKSFHEIDGRNLDTELLTKLNNVRNMRKNAVHPHTTQISESQSRDCINNISEIIMWIVKNRSSQ